MEFVNEFMTEKFEQNPDYFVESQEVLDDNGAVVGVSGEDAAFLVDHVLVLERLLDGRQRAADAREDAGDGRDAREVLDEDGEEEVGEGLPAERKRDG